MAEIVLVEEKNVKSVSVTGERISIYGEIVRDANNSLKIFSGRVQDNDNSEMTVGDVYYTANETSGRVNITSYVNVTPDYYLDSLDLFSDSVKQILNGEF